MNRQPNFTTIRGPWPYKICPAVPPPPIPKKPLVAQPPRPPLVTLHQLAIIDCLVAEGVSIAQIAARLALSRETVGRAYHRRSTYKDFPPVGFARAIPSTAKQTVQE